jgi:hypothetical protein
MNRDRENRSSLQQRVNDYLRREGNGGDLFASPAQAAEADLREYLLERAEAELRATRARIEELQRELSRIR